MVSPLPIQRKVGSALELPRLPAAVEEYLQAQVAGKPWCDHLSLAALALAGLGYSASHSCKMLRVLHRRFLAIAGAAGASATTPVPAPEQLAAYVRGLIVPEDTIARRDEFVQIYWHAFERARSWLALLPPEGREILAAFLLPEIDLVQLRALLRGRPLPSFAPGAAQQHAPSSYEQPGGEAITSLLCSARSRYSHLCTLYLAYQEGVTGPGDGSPTLPRELPALTLHEPDRSITLRLRLWDRRSLCDAFPEQFSEWQRQQLQRQPTDRSSGDELFLEALPGEDASEQPPGPWYLELLKRGVFGNRAEWGAGRHLAARQQWLRSWGYSSNLAGRVLAPFATSIPGLLAWPNARSLPRFIEPLQQCLSGALVPAGALAAGGAFGLLALELSAGIDLSGEALLGATTGSVWRSGNERLVALLQSLALLEQTAATDRLRSSLRAHAEALQTGSLDTLLGQGLFAYGRHALTSGDLAACLRFLLHGISYDDGGKRRTLDGHSSRRLIDMMLGISPSRPRARPRASA
jgi:hypothetical protein